MKREIKFRVWDSKNMLSNHEINGDWLLAGKFGSLEVMQFTGLKDKNGKEIFEGDVVSWKVGSMYGTATVSFYDACFRLSGYVSEDNALNTAFCKSQCEIIGNIYQNPQLIK